MLCSLQGEQGRRHLVSHPMKGFPFTGGFFLWPKVKEAWRSREAGHRPTIGLNPELWVPPGAAPLPPGNKIAPPCATALHGRKFRVRLTGESPRTPRHKLLISPAASDQEDGQPSIFGFGNQPSIELVVAVDQGESPPNPRVQVNPLPRNVPAGRNLRLVFEVGPIGCIRI